MNYVLGTVPMHDNSLNTKKKIIHVIGKPQIIKPRGQMAPQLLLELWQCQAPMPFLYLTTFSLSFYISLYSSPPAISPL